MKQWILTGLALGVLGAAAPAGATIISVIGPNSSMGVAPAIIGAPAHLLDDVVTNMGMQGFDEAQDVVTSMAYAIDGGILAAGTSVDSHMIFLNSAGSTLLTHSNVIWTFSGAILGIMSNTPGTMEAASTGELGNPLTNYTVTFIGSGPAAPFPNRGLEGADSYLILAPNQLRVSMRVSEPGDWIRVVTVPEPGMLGLIGAGLLGLGFRARRQKP
jgi:hypothetical protein